MPGLPEATPLDPRAARTRARVIDAYVRLVREHPHADLRVADLLRDAGVGRATFYAHFRGKDEVLVRALGRLWPALADALLVALRDEEARSRLERLLAHIGENRVLFRRMSAAAEPWARSAHELATLLGERVETWLAERGRAPRLPVSHAAAPLAQALLALLREWLVGPDAGRATPAELARAARELARGHVAALG